MEDLMAKIISLAKRRGFVFQSSEIYGGFSSCYDFGPLGVEMKNNIKKIWWQEMTRKHNNVFGLDAAVLMSPNVWQASGHLTAGFADKLVECKNCHKRFRADMIEGNKCPLCGGELTEPRDFNLMMKTFTGPVSDKASETYLRAETCQGIYVNFQNVLQSMRTKVPFGICQIGKAFRNEITTKNFIFRMREFEQMELEWFTSPKEVEKWYDFWLNERLKWYETIGIKKEHLKLVEIGKEERAHYARRQIDIEYKFPFGWKEIEGIHNRGDWDLSNHSKHSGKDLSYTDPLTGEKYYPYIVETSVGVERLLLALLVEGFTEVQGGRTKTTEAKKENEIVLELDKRIAPLKVVVLPLVKNKPEIVKKAKEVYQLVKVHFFSQYDETGSIGRRYRRADEVGVPFALTIDFDSLERDDVTVRYLETMEQKRLKIKEILPFLEKELGNG